MRIEENYSLQAYNTFGIALNARWFMEYETEEELNRILADEYFLSCRRIHIGGGSNLLFLNSFFDGIALHSAIKGINVEAKDGDTVVLRVGAGERWDDVVEYAVANGLHGIENLSDIPGEAGGAAVQNIGAYGAEIADAVHSVEAYDVKTGKKHIFSNEDCQYAYRSSRFKDDAEEMIVAYVSLRLSLKPCFNIEYAGMKENLDEISLRSVRNRVIEIRRRKLPDLKTLGSAGSFFMNPLVSTDDLERIVKDYPNLPRYDCPDGKVKLSAAWLIDSCGMKGYARDNAGVHSEHALVLVNLGGASGTDIAMLAADIQNVVFDKFGIELKPEVKFID